MLGQTFGRFQVVAPLGRGAMATVWKAEDRLLGRPVALKVLSESHMASPRMRRRFLQEARLASALDHPGIATVYDTGESEGRVYIAFALIDGKTISEQLADGPLEIEECVRIGIAAAEALGHAHAHGVIHRDLSARNIMVARDGRVYVLDFGLARIRGAARITTESQVLLGTLPYLAPEIVRGRKATPAADVYGLGAVLYEALTGTPPLGSGEAAAMLYAILNETAPPLRDSRPEIPPALDELIVKTLSKDPRRRPVGGNGLAEALAGLDLAERTGRDPARPIGGGVDTGVGRRPARSVQVFPFEDLGTGTDEGGGLLARGLAENLSASLARLPGLQVIGPSLPDAGRPHGAAGAQLLLRGTVRRSGAGLRVAFSLINARSGVQQGGGALDGSITAPFDLEDRLAASVAEALGYEDAEPPRLRGPRDPAAHEHYLRALGYLQRYDNEASVEGAIRLLEGLLASEGDSASVDAALARAYLHKYRHTYESRWEALAASACEKALAQDPRAVDVLLTLGQVHATVGRNADAIEAFRQVLELQPDHAEACLGLSTALEANGQIAEAETAARRAIAARPSSWSGHNRLGLLCFRAARYEDALGAWEEVVRLSPDNSRGHYNRGAAYYHLDRLGDAVEALRCSIAIEPTAAAYASLGTTLFDLGRHDEAVRAFESATALRPADPNVWGNLGSACRRMPGREVGAANALGRAVTLMRERLNRNPVDSEGWAMLAGWLANLGREREVEEALGRWAAIEPRDVRSMALAGVTYLGLGRREEGLHWLRESLNRGYSVRALRREPELEKLRDDPAVRGLLWREDRPTTEDRGASPGKEES